MKKTTDQICSSMALIFVCVSMFVSLGLAADQSPTHQLPHRKLMSLVGFFPPGGFTDAKKCWSSLQSIEGCVFAISRSFLTGKIQSLGPVCCKAFVAVDEACWPKMFPFNPFFPLLVKSYCAINGGGPGAAAAATTPPTPTPTIRTDEGIAHNMQKIDIGILPPPRGFTDAKKCWSPLQSIEGGRCVVQIFKSFSTGTIQHLDAACCKGIATVNQACWTKTFPSNPLFPELLKAYCNMTHGKGKAPTPPRPPSSI